MLLFNQLINLEESQNFKIQEFSSDEDSPKFQEKLKQINRQEVLARSSQNNENQLTRCFEKQFELFSGNPGNENVLLKVFTKNLRLCGDKTIQKKLNNNNMTENNNNLMNPFITLKSYLLLYEGVKDFLTEVLNEIDVILIEMESLYSRKRSLPSLQDVAVDLKRLRSVKGKQILNSSFKASDAFKFNGQKFAFRQEISVDLVQEALKRIGANNFGPSKRFAEVLNRCFELDNNDDIDLVGNDLNIDYSADYHINDNTVFESSSEESIKLEDSDNTKDPITAASLKSKQSMLPLSLSAIEIDKLQAAIKNKLSEKLNNK